MGFGGWLFAAMYDRMLARTEKAGLRAFRARLLESARGRVLEIGAGTGANLPLYGPRVEMLTVTEPEAPSWPLRKATRISATVRLMLSVTHSTISGT